MISAGDRHRAVGARTVTACRLLVLGFCLAQVGAAVGRAARVWLVGFQPRSGMLAGSLPGATLRSGSSLALTIGYELEPAARAELFAELVPGVATAVDLSAPQTLRGRGRVRGRLGVRCRPGVEERFSGLRLRLLLVDRGRRLASSEVAIPHTFLCTGLPATGAPPEAGGCADPAVVELSARAVASALSPWGSGEINLRAVVANLGTLRHDAARSRLRLKLYDQQIGRPPRLVRSLAIRSLDPGERLELSPRWSWDPSAGGLPHVLAILAFGVRQNQAAQADCNPANNQRAVDVAARSR